MLHHVSFSFYIFLLTTILLVIKISKAETNLDQARIPKLSPSPSSSSSTTQITPPINYTYKCTTDFTSPCGGSHPGGITRADCETKCTECIPMIKAGAQAVCTGFAGGSFCGPIDVLAGKEGCMCDAGAVKMICEVLGGCFCVVDS